MSPKVPTTIAVFIAAFCLLAFTVLPGYARAVASGIAPTMYLPVVLKQVPPKIAVLSNLNIYRMNPDGSDKEQLTDNNCAGAPSLANDTEFVVFANECDNEIYLIEVGDTEPMRLTNNRVADIQPALSPDGERIAFVSDRDADGDYEIFVMNLDGSAVSQLTSNTARDEEPAWAPDGERIAFMSDRDGANPEIYVMNVDGSNQTRLTDNIAIDQSPDWSPFGNRIVYASNADGDFEIITMEPDGSNQVQLTRNSQRDLAPSWSPRGFEIVYYSFTSAGRSIMLIEPDGANDDVVITGNFTDPDW
ncbi:MAG: PD40 domain-containing protein [Caldilineaceae bacterium]|nr:PD40 domain-containing protein [Caldilineaceae bacterium]